MSSHLRPSHGFQVSPVLGAAQTRCRKLIPVPNSLQSLEVPEPDGSKPLVELCYHRLMFPRVHGVARAVALRLPGL